MREKKYEDTSHPGEANGPRFMPRDSDDQQNLPGDRMPPPHNCEEGGPRDPTPMMLIHDANKLFDNLVRESSDFDNLQASFRHLLFHLQHSNGCTQLQLAKSTHLKAPTVSVTLQKMERDGFVTRCSDENDLRQTLVFITDKGREYNDRIHNKIDELDEKVLVGISPEEEKAVCDILRRIVGNLIKESGGRGPHEIV